MKIAKISEFKEYIKDKKYSKQLANAPSTLQFALFDSINFVATQVWEQVVPQDKLLMRHPYLSAVEQSSEQTHHHRYVIMYKDQQPVAVAVFNIIDIAGEDFGAAAQRSSTRTKKVVNKIKDKAVLRILICGNVLLSGQHGFCYTNEIDSNTAYHALWEVALRIKLAEKRGVKFTFS
jgi:hypothetical protein